MNVLGTWTRQTHLESVGMQFDHGELHSGIAVDRQPLQGWILQPYSIAACNHRLIARAALTG
ncbi:MAG: hypothetical protein K0M58_03150 [Thiobacillus sp.]|nr:hypothetical protein [Thiobacillus sp.]